MGTVISKRDTRCEMRTTIPKRQCLRGWLCMLGTIFLIWNATSFQVSASEEIRVSLAENASRVVLSASYPIILQFSSGQRVQESSPVVIQTAREGLRVNGRQLKFRTVFAKARRGELSLTVQRATSKIFSEKNGRRWKLSGGVDIQRHHSRLLVVNRVDVEDYVAGVITGEINTNWHREALRAQSVAARTYVLYKKMMNQDQPYDVVSSVQDQVYQGQAHVNAKVAEAVRATKGKVITLDGRPILAAYSSTAAGPTEDAQYVWAIDVPYLKGVECPFDDASPRYRWREVVPIQKLENQFRKSEYAIGSIATITPYTYTPSGRINHIRILHSQGELILRGQDFRRVAGYSTIYSTQFHIESIGREVVFTGKGSGHGVGLCQWGMKEMADLGYSHEAIVHYYYPGTELLSLSHVNLSPLLEE